MDKILVRTKCQALVEKVACEYSDDEEMNIVRSWVEKFPCRQFISFKFPDGEMLCAGHGKARIVKDAIEKGTVIDLRQSAL